MKTKLKILYIVNSLNIGGSEKVLIDSANSLDPERYSVSIISLSLFDTQKSILKIVSPRPEIEVLYFDFEFFADYSIAGYLKLLLKSKKSYKGLDAIIEAIHKIHPNLIHFHTSPRELILHKFFKLNVPYVFTDHLLRISKNEMGALQEKLLAFIFRKLYANMHIVAVSEEIRKNLYSRKIVSPERKILTVLNGVNVDFFKNTNKPPETEGLVAAYISRIEHIKGHADLVKAWALLKDIPKKQLYLAGPDGINGKIQALAKELGCYDSIVFTGPISDARALLQKSTLAIFPSYKEGLPLSLLEKMAMSLPVIVSDIAELTSIISHNENGLVYKLGDAEALAEAIRYLNSNPMVAQKLGENARATVLSTYNFAENTKKLDVLYKSLLN